MKICAKNSKDQPSVENNWKMTNEMTGIHSPLCGTSATKWDYSNGWLEVKMDKDRKREMERSFDFWQGKKDENAKMECESDKVKRGRIS